MYLEGKEEDLDRDGIHCVDFEVVHKGELLGMQWRRTSWREIL